MTTHEADPPALNPIPPRLSADNVGQYRSEYTRLFLRYQQLSWSTSAIEQRERAALQQPLMELYRILHPATLSVHLDDDFDTLMRARRRM
jgi:hypothetical protein